MAKPSGDPKKKTKKKRKKPAEKQLKCDVCGKRYYWQCQLAYHQLVHTGEKPYACSTCGKAFNSHHSLKSHTYIHTNEKPFKCSFCAYACRDSSTLRKHQNRHIGKVKSYQCTRCSKSFTDKWRLKLHVAEAHLKVTLERLPCTRCDKLFKTQATLTTHIRTVHEKRLACECPVCGKRLSSRANLPAHLTTHVDARPYCCTVEGCEKTYKDTSSLAKHTAVHNPDLQHPCSSCGKLFSRRYRLNHHWKTVHCKKKCVECDYCGTRFYSKSYLINHIQRKHGKKRKKFKCDLCGFVSYNKPSLIMHIKYGHVSESDRKCKMCKTVYKKHAYLKNHYKRTHGIIYKTKKKPLLLEIKDEPLDDTPILDLFEIEKEELESNLDTNETADNEDKSVIEKHDNLKDIPEDFFKEFFVSQIVDPYEGKEKKRVTKYKENLDEATRQLAKKSVAELLDKVKEKRAIEQLEKARLEYNKRIKELLENDTKKKKIKVKFFNKTKQANSTRESDKRNKNSDDTESSNIDNNASNTVVDASNNDDTLKLDEALKCDDISNLDADISNNNNRSKRIVDASNAKVTSKSDDASKTCDNASNVDDDVEITSDDGDDDDDYTDDTKDTNKNTKIQKVKFNSHQCYVCFKLYQTKEELIDHCKNHFDICTDKPLKKCPLCEFVTKFDIIRHMKLIHKIHIKVPYTRIKDNLINTEKSRYYHDIDNPVVDKMEIIPSVRNLNRMACVKFDKHNREDKNKTVAKTKLVRKGKEWIVEKEKIKFDNDIIMPEFDKEAFKNVKVSDSDTYFDSLKKLYHVAKKSGKKILFPCQKCDKICQNLAALKLHYRKHDSNKKPFKPKVWKHKQKQSVKQNRSKTEPVIDTGNRIAKPKPITNKHKCDPELKEFYKNNIRGGDIEFWQFLKIYNKMDRENIKDFNDLKDKYDYGLEHHYVETKTDDALEISQKTKKTATKKKNEKIKKNVRFKVTKSDAKTKTYKRVIRLSRDEYRTRNLAKQLLREKLAKNKMLT